MSNEIKIHKIIGPEDGEDLKGCYFLDAGDGTYNFFDHENRQLNPIPITPGTTFGFTLPATPELGWSMRVDKMNDKKGNGDWSYTMAPRPADSTGDGTFQAQAGGTGEPTDADDAAASATA